MRSLETIVWDHRRSQSVSSISFSLSHFNHLASKEQNIRYRKRLMCTVVLLSPAGPRLFSHGWEECGSLSWSGQGKVADSTMLFLLPVDQERKPGWRVRLRSRRGRGSLCSPLGKVGFIVTFNSFPVSKQKPPGAEASSWVVPTEWEFSWGMRMAG